jgi:serine protease AprX
MVDEFGNVEFIAEPTDSQILTAVDPSVKGHQDGWRAEVMGWAPAPALPLPRVASGRNRIVNISIFFLIILVVWMIWRSQIIQGLEAQPESSEWVFESTGVRALQAQGLTGAGVSVCIVDTGIDSSHPDLDHLSYTFTDLWGSSATAVDHGNLAHGTLMVGLLAADGHQKGIAPAIRLGIVAALGDDGMGNNSGSESLVADAIRWCWQSFGADIISLSLGGIQDQNQTREGQSVSAVRQALDHGVFVVAAVGNDGGIGDDGLVAVPGNVDLVITVGASDSGGKMWNGSSMGSQIADDGLARLHPNQKPEVVAPGVAVISTGNNGHYYASTGSSISTVIITGILALILEDNPRLKSDGVTVNSNCIEAVKLALRSSSVAPIAGVDHDDHWGYGVVSATAWAQEAEKIVDCSSQS